MKLNLLLIFILFSIFSWSQEKNIVLRIDTLDFIDKYEDYWNFKVFVTNQGFANNGEQFDSADFKFNDFPQYYNNIIFRTDSSQLRIPFDNLGGFVEINGLYESAIDTIRIEKFTLYSNCNFDTVNFWKTYFENDTLLIDKDKSYFKTEIKELECERKAPSILNLKINGKEYQLPVAFEAKQAGLITTGNGSRRTIFGKEKNRFHFRAVHSYGINTVQINLKN